MRVDSICMWGVGVENRSSFEYLNPAFTCKLAVAVASIFTKIIIIPFSCTCVNKARTQRKLADVILEHFLNIRDEIRSLSQQPNFSIG